MSALPTGGPLDSRAPLMRPKDVAAYLNVNVFLVYRALESGELVGHKIGSRPKAPWRVRIEDVERWANA
jgi:excisionase family DNA binding protein